MTLRKFARMSAVAVGALAVASQVNAADFSAGRGYKDAPVYVAAPAWTGFYLGMHVGGVWTDMKTTDIDGSWAGYAGDTFNNLATGIVGGGQVGYNFQYGNIVFGPEADFGGLGVAHNQGAFGGGYGYYSRVNDGFYADVTGRLGYAAGPALFYLKGGWAIFDGGLGLVDAVDSYAASHSSADGWTLGGGIEYKLSSAWSVKGEYRHFDFGNVTETLYPVGFACDSTSSVSGLCRFKQTLDADTVTVGLNYIWGGTFYTPLK